MLKVLSNKALIFAHIGVYFYLRDAWFPIKQMKAEFFIVFQSTLSRNILIQFLLVQQQKGPWTWITTLHTSLISFVNVDVFVSISSSIPILVKICSAIRKEQYSAGT